MLSTVNSMYWPLQDIHFDLSQYLGGETERDIQLIGLDLEHVIFTWCYTLVWFLIQDNGKTICYNILFHFDVCSIKTNHEANEARIVKNASLLAAKHKLKSDAILNPATTGTATDLV